MLRVSLFVLVFSISQLTFAEMAPKKSVFVVKATKTALWDGFTFPARVVPKVVASVVSEYQGLVQKIHLPLGGKVSKGDALMVIKHADPAFNYRPMIVRAPVDGIVSKLLVQEGGQVSQGERVMVLAKPNPARIETEIGARDLPFINTGMEGKFTMRGQQEDLKVRVVGVSPIVDPATGSASAELEFIESDLAVAPGSLGKVQFSANQHDGIALPEHALSYRGRDAFVRLVSEGKVKKANVKLGAKRRGMVEILEGVQDGDIVVERASGFLPEGAEVEVKESENNGEKG
jgi:multidrug efflux pump subunit AcrA (membrane-fusion protein)